MRSKEYRARRHATPKRVHVNPTKSGNTAENIIISKGNVIKETTIRGQKYYSPLSTTKEV